MTEGGARIHKQEMPVSLDTSAVPDIFSKRNSTREQHRKKINEKVSKYFVAENTTNYK
jgi:hypothetical protein